MNFQVDAAAAIKRSNIKKEILRALSGLEYGQLLILIKDGKVTQIEKTEKKRLPRLEGLHGDGI